MLYTVQAAILGYSRTFSVNIDGDQPVSELQNRIKTANHLALALFEASSLEGFLSTTNLLELLYVPYREPAVPFASPGSTCHAGSYCSGIVLVTRTCINIGQQIIILPGKWVGAMP